MNRVGETGLIPVSTSHTTYGGSLSFDSNLLVIVRQEYIACLSLAVVMEVARMGLLAICQKPFLMFAHSQALDFCCRLSCFSEAGLQFLSF